MKKPQSTEPALLKKPKTLVIKVGSSLVTNHGAGLDRQAIDSWAAQIAQLLGLGIEAVLVSSGAVAEGIQRLGWPRRPSSIHELQAAAAVGRSAGRGGRWQGCYQPPKPRRRHPHRSLASSNVETPRSAISCLFRSPMPANSRFSLIFVFCRRGGVCGSGTGGNLAAAPRHAGAE